MIASLAQSRRSALAGITPLKRHWAGQVALVVAGSLIVALLAQVSIRLPFTPVPVTGQTLAVLLVGGALGSQLGATLRFLHDRYHVRDAVASTYLQQALSDLHAWPHLCAAPMLLDMDASQFLHQNGEISGLIDTELYVAGPPEMELTGLEFLLSPHAAAWVRRGYEEVSPMPSLTRVRRVFRILLRMLSFQGPVPWDEWMDAPHRFTS